MESNIQIVGLSPTARFPLNDLPLGDMPWKPMPRKNYVPFTISPQTSPQVEALRAWISTHQSMFLSIGAASSALASALDHIANHNFTSAVQCLDLARDFRLASAVYTVLPTVGRGIYEEYLRPAMMGVRPSFSGVSSRESIEFAVLIKILRETPLPPRASSAVQSTFADARAGALDADDTWWRLHASAMRRMVTSPISLAQLEYKRESEAGGARISYSEFLATALQVPGAMDDYDRFFACERSCTTALEYLDNYQFSLSISDKYISQSEPMISYRSNISQLVEQLKQLAQSSDHPSK